MKSNHISRRSIVKALGVGAAASAMTTALAQASTRNPGFYVNMAQDAGELTIYTWYQNWIDELKDPFTEETGIKVNLVGTYSSNDEWWARLLSGESFDFFMPTSDWVQRAIKADLIQAVDHEKIPNLSTLEVDYQDADAYKNEEGMPFAVPFSRLWYALTYNTNVYSEAPTSWAAMWDEAQKGKITAWDNAMGRVSTTAIYLGDDPYNPSDWDAIQEALMEQKALVQKYWKDYQAGMEMFINEEAVIGELTDGRVRMGIKAGGPMQWTVPTEGALVEVDTFAIPKAAKNPDAAHVFIDFLYRPENMVKLMEGMGYDTVSAEARELLPEDMVPGFEAPEGSKGFVTKDLDPAVRSRMDELWTEVQLS